MNQLRISTFGTFRVTLDDTRLAPFRSKKARALLAFLALEGNRAHSRDSLATLLWGEFPQQAARTNLRVELSGLRKLLAVPGVARRDGAWLAVTRHTVHFDTEHPDCWVDALEFHSLITACERHAHEALARCGLCVERMVRAASVYRGTLLEELAPLGTPGWDEWRAQRAWRLHAAMRWVHAALVEHYQATGDQAEARRYAAQRAALDTTLTPRPLPAARSQPAQLPTKSVTPATSDTATSDDGALARLRAAPFAGREAEVQEVVERWIDPAYPLITLMGEPGIGKSRLAVEAATRLAGWRDGALPVELSVETVPLLRAVEEAAGASSGWPALARALGLSGQPEDTPGAARLEELAAGPRYLLLDGLDPLLDKKIASSLLGLLQATPDLQLLVTSRARLNVAGEWVLRLDGLSLDTPPGQKQGDSAAAELFAHHARLAHPGFELDDSGRGDVQQIVALLDGHPLAIAAAASWCATLNCRQIATRLAGDRLALSRPAGKARGEPGDLSSRFEQAWQRVAAGERAILHRLLHLPPSFDWREASRATGAGLLEVTSLVDQALLRQSADTWTLSLHPLWRAYLLTASENSPPSPICED